jgi:two-component system sensor histidine kinase UhpB
VYNLFAAMAFKLKQLLARGPEVIQAEKVFIKEFPLQELGLTLLFVVVAGFWLVFWGDIVDWIMGVEINSPYVQTLRGINFVTTTSIVLYLVLRRTLRRRRQAEEALRLSQQRFESVALATTDAIWDFNLDTKVIWWSDGVQKLFGYSAEDISTRVEWWLERVHPDDRDKVVEAIGKVAESGGTGWAGEYRFRRKDGSYAIVWDRGYIVCDAAGKPARFVGGICDVTERRLAEIALENSRRQLRALTTRLQAGREQERAAVAREIHDDLGQMLTALKVNLDRLERTLEQPGHESTFNPLLERVVESAEIVENAIQSVQRIATDLRPPVLDHLGLVEALRQEALRFKERSGIACELRLPDSPVNLPPETSTAVFRVLQEALTNVVRHAQATAARVSFEMSGPQLVLEIEDDGKGIEPDAIADARSLGLLGMAERAAALGGHVAVAPIVPHGTRVTLRLPNNADVPIAK